MLTEAELTHRYGRPGSRWKERYSGEVRELIDIAIMDGDPPIPAARWKIVTGGIPERTGKWTIANMIPGGSGVSGCTVQFWERT